MSIEVATGHTQQTGWPPETTKRWLSAVLWSGIAIFLSLAYGALEKYGFGWPNSHQLCVHPDSLVMLALGLPHFWIALLFVVTSKRLKTRRGIGWFLGLLVLSGLLLLAFSRFGGSRNPVLYLLTLFYFLVHDFRDQVFFFRTSPMFPKNESPPRDMAIVALQFMLISLLFAFLVPTYLRYLDLKGRLPDEDPVLDFFYPASWPFLVRFAVYLAPPLIVSGLLGWIVQRRYPNGWRGIWRDLHPILLIFIGYVLIVFSTFVIGAGAFSFIIIVHVVGWYLYTIRKLGQAPRAPPTRNPLAWFRSTVRGFQTLHIGLALLLIGIYAFSAYAYGRSDWVPRWLGQQTFSYWAIFHITISFCPR